MFRKIVIATCTAVLGVGMVAATSAPAEAAAKKYSNCKQLNKDYKHGVGRPGAKDKTSGTPVTTFKRSKAIYNKNTGRDRDKDGIACEKK